MGRISRYMAAVAAAFFSMSILAGNFSVAGNIQAAVEAADSVKAFSDTLRFGPDSLEDNYLRVSLLIAGKGAAVYSTFGHAAVRIQCPSKDADLAYTYEAEIKYLKFIEGGLMANFMVEPTQSFLDTYAKEERNVTEYALNLTPREKLCLWRNLRRDNMEGPDGRFDLVRNNCLSAALFQIENSLYGERIEYCVPEADAADKGPREAELAVNGRFFREVLASSPWLKFATLFFLGVECDKTWPYEQRLEPLEAGVVLQKSMIVSSDEVLLRPVAGEGKTLVSFPPKAAREPSPLTPELIFGLLFALSLALTIGELSLKWKLSVRIFDISLFIFQTIVGCFLFYESCIGGFLGIHWNWYLIPFNPFPIVYWLLRGKYETHEHIYFFYALSLLVFLAAMPFVTSQISLAGELLVSAIFVRCIGLTFKRRYNR